MHVCTYVVVSCSPDLLLSSIFIIMMPCGLRVYDVIIIKMEARSGSGLHKITYVVGCMGSSNFKVCTYLCYLHTPFAIAKL